MRWVVLIALAFVLSGCLSQAAGDQNGTDPLGGQSPSGANAGTAATHGTPQRSETPVTVTMTPTGGYVASKEVTVRNDFGGAAQGHLDLRTLNGNVAATTWNQGGYQLVARLEARGASEEEARATLATMVVASSDQLSAGVLSFGLQVQFKDLPAQGPSPLPVSIHVNDGRQRSANVEASLPVGPSETLTAKTTNGGIAVSALHGPRLELDTTNGNLRASGSWDTADLDTTNGNVELEGLFNDLQVSSTNGNLGGTVESSRSSRQDLDTTNGGISLKIKDGGHGYDLKGSTTNGRITIDVAGARAEGKDAQHAATPGFDSEAVKVRVDAQSTNGNISLTGA